MAWDSKDVLQTLQSLIKKTGAVSDCHLGEPESAAPDRDRPFCALWMSSGPNVYEMTVDGSIHEQHVVLVRFYRTAFRDREQTEIAIADALQTVIGSLVSDQDLGTNVMSVDPGGIAGTTLSVDWDSVFLNNTWHRVADVTFPVVVADESQVTA